MEYYVVSEDLYRIIGPFPTLGDDKQNSYYQMTSGSTIMTAEELQSIGNNIKISTN